MLFIISGPSGCGKSTLAQRVLDEVEDLAFSVSHTTRKARSNEEQGRDYYFVSKKEFRDLIQANKLAEWAEVHGELYGTSLMEIGKKGRRKDLLLDIDVQGAQQIKKSVKKAVFVFILPPAFPELKRRLVARGQNSSREVRKRLEIARREIREYPSFDFIIVNDDLEKAVAELKSVITCTRCRLAMRQKDILPILRSFSEEAS